jgi:hypothetical protein
MFPLGNMVGEWLMRRTQMALAGTVGKGLKYLRLVARRRLKA